jgi:hypothetical protein
MNNNYLSTIPQIADNLRVKGVQIPRYNNYNFQPVDSSNPANKEYRDNWRDEAIKKVYDGLKNIYKSKLDLLQEPYFPRRNTNTAQMPFQTSQNLPSFSVGKIGRGNITQSSALSDTQYDKYRRELLKNRFDDYQRLKGVVAPPAQVEPTNTISDNDRKQIKSAFSSLTAKVNSGIADASTFNDLSQIVNYFDENIWKYTESVELLNFIRSLESVQESLNALYENINSNELDDRAQEEYLQYSVSMYNTIESLIDYIEKALNNVGRSEMERKALSNINEGESKNPLKPVSRKSIAQPQAPQAPPSQYDIFMQSQLPSQLQYEPELNPMQRFEQTQQEPEPQFNEGELMPVKFDIARFLKGISNTISTFRKKSAVQVRKLAELFGVNEMNPDGTRKNKDTIYLELKNIKDRFGSGRSRRKRRGGDVRPRSNAVNLYLANSMSYDPITGQPVYRPSGFGRKKRGRGQDDVNRANIELQQLASSDIGRGEYIRQRNMILNRLGYNDRTLVNVPTYVGRGRDEVNEAQKKMAMLESERINLTRDEYQRRKDEIYKNINFNPRLMHNQ